MQHITREGPEYLIIIAITPSVKPLN